MQTQMKSTQLTRLHVSHKRRFITQYIPGSKYVVLIFFFFMPHLSFAQSEKETDLGISTALELQKDLNRFLTMGIEEEVRLKNNSNGFDRSVTTLGLDYALFDKKIKIGAYYAFLYLYNNDHLYEARHRYYFNLSYKHSLEQFTLSWRGRFQGTYRDENRGAYKINPKYIMKNKFEIEYAIWGRPWKPYISCDFSTDLNNPKGNDLTRIRYQGGTSWRLNRTDFLDFFMRFDQYIAGDDPNVLNIGFAYKIKL